MIFNGLPHFLSLCDCSRAIAVVKVIQRVHSYALEVVALGKIVLEAQALNVIEPPLVNRALGLSRIGTVRFTTLNIRIEVRSAEEGIPGRAIRDVSVI